MPRFHRILPLLSLFAVACNKDSDDDGVPDDFDCSAEDATAFPGNPEVCDGVDNDCDGIVDGADATDAPGWFMDADGDGYGSANWYLNACSAPDGYVADSSDCDDDHAEVHPTAEETCDGLDNDCDSTVDEEARDATTWYEDGDGDGYGDREVMSCNQDPGLVDISGDCDDAEAGTHPGAAELCDGEDNDCDGAPDGVEVPADYATIADALAEIDDGTLICLAPGTHAESLEVDGQTLNLGSTDGEASTSIDLSGGGWSLYDAEGSRIVGVRFTGSDRSGTALYVERSDGLVLDEVSFVENNCATYYCNTLLSVQSSDIDLREVGFHDNHNSQSMVDSTTYASEGGLFYAEYSDVRWDGGGFWDNTVDIDVSYTAYYAQVGVSQTMYVYGGQIDLRDLRFENNSTSITTSGYYAQVWGGGSLGLEWVTGTADGLTISGNSESFSAKGTSYGYAYRYGLFGFNEADLDLSGVSIADNAVELFGEGPSYSYVYNYDSTMGYGDYRWSGLSIRGNRTEISGTNAYSYLYGWYIDNADVQMSQVDIRGNHSEISSSLDAYDYGSFYAYESTWQLTNAIIAGNTSESGESSRGFIYCEDSSLGFENAAITGNEVKAARVSAFITVYSEGDVDFTNTSIDANTVDAEDTDSDYPATIIATLWADNAFGGMYNNVHGNDASGGFGWTNGVSFEPTAAAGLLTKDPEYTSTSGDASTWDLHLKSSSDLVDAGDPSILDTDGSTSDIGAYGGPGGSW